MNLYRLIPILLYFFIFNFYLNILIFSMHSSDISNIEFISNQDVHLPSSQDDFLPSNYTDQEIDNLNKIAEELDEMNIDNYILNTSNINYYLVGGILLGLLISKSYNYFYDMYNRKNNYNLNDSSDNDKLNIEFQPSDFDNL